MAKLSKEHVTPVTEAIDNWVEGITISIRELSEDSQRAVSDATRLHEPDTSPGTAFANAARVWSTWARKMGKMASDLADGLALLAASDGPTMLFSVDPLPLPDVEDGDYWFELDPTNELKWSEGSLGASTDEAAADDVIEVAFFAVTNGRQIKNANGHRLVRHKDDWVDEVQLRIIVPRSSDKPIPVGTVSGNLIMKTYFATYTIRFYDHLA